MGKTIARAIMLVKAMVEFTYETFVQTLLGRTKRCKALV
jgi:hypothetical protein